jgi:hypothetical protein
MLIRLRIVCKILISIVQNLHFLQWPLGALMLGHALGRTFLQEAGYLGWPPLRSGPILEWTAMPSSPLLRTSYCGQVIHSVSLPSCPF